MALFCVGCATTGEAPSTKPLLGSMSFRPLPRNEEEVEKQRKISPLFRVVEPAWIYMQKQGHRKCRAEDKAGRILTLKLWHDRKFSSLEIEDNFHGLENYARLTRLILDGQARCTGVEQHGTASWPQACSNPYKRDNHKARWDKDCQVMAACTLAGRCETRGCNRMPLHMPTWYPWWTECIAVSKQKCQASLGCKTEGNCALDTKLNACVPSSQEHCRQSESCLKRGEACMYYPSERKCTKPIGKPWTPPASKGRIKPYLDTVPPRVRRIHEKVGSNTPELIDLDTKAIFYQGKWYDRIPISKSGQKPAVICLGKAVFLGSLIYCPRGQARDTREML